MPIVLPVLGFGGPKPKPASFLATTAAANGGGDNTLDISRPGSPSAGDLLLAFILGESSVSVETSTRPTGYVNKFDSGSQIFGENNPGFFTVDAKVATASEPSTYQWTAQGAAGEHVFCIATFEDTSPDQLDVVAGAISATAATTVTAPNITTVHPQTRVFTAYYLNRAGNNVATITTPPTGMTLRADADASVIGGIGRVDLRLVVFEDDVVIQKAGTLFTGKSLTMNGNTTAFSVTFGIRAKNTQ